MEQLFNSVRRQRMRKDRDGNLDGGLNERRRKVNEFRKEGR